MNLKDWIIYRLGGTPQSMTMEEFMNDEEVQSIVGELALQELAFWSCVNKIAKVLSKCEFRTYVENKEVKDREYYRWNFEPNQNQSAVTFFTKLLGQLYTKNEALCVEVNGGIYVAESYDKEEYALKDHVFKNVHFDGLTLNRTFYQRDVLFFRLNSEDMKALTEKMYANYQKLIAYSYSAFLKSRGNRGILNISAQASTDKLFKDRFAKLMGEHFKKFFKSENGVLPLFEGYKYDDLSNNKTYTSETTRDIKALSDDIFDYTARAFSFPPSLAKGDVQDTSKAVEELLTFCLDPLTKLLETEINRKENGYAGFKRGDFMRIDTVRVKHFDILDIATPIEKLISSGTFTINDIRRIMGEPPIDEEWANTHFMTKNYSTIQDLIEQMGTGSDRDPLKGGENT